MAAHFRETRRDIPQTLKKKRRKHLSDLKSLGITAELNS
jgi:hypothetical protein